MLLEKVVFKTVNTNLAQSKRPVKVALVFWKAKSIGQKRSIVLLGLFTFLKQVLSFIVLLGLFTFLKLVLSLKRFLRPCW